MQGVEPLDDGMHPNVIPLDSRCLAIPHGDPGDPGENFHDQFLGLNREWPYTRSTRHRKAFRIGANRDRRPRPAAAAAKQCKRSASFGRGAFTIRFF